MQSVSIGIINKCFDYNKSSLSTWYWANDIALPEEDGYAEEKSVEPVNVAYTSYHFDAHHMENTTTYIQ